MDETLECFDLFDEEEAKFEESEEAYEAYITEVVECPCGLMAPRYKMEDHWCDDLEEQVNALRTKE